MIRNLLFVAALGIVAPLTASTFTSAQANCCQCCGDSCRCENCACDASGCACDVGGDCACDDACCTAGGCSHCSKD